MAARHLQGILQHFRRVLSTQPADALSDGQLLERFTKHRDASAFEALVQRHGPMVLGVCRRVLADEHDAEDAFQATLLVLVRKAASIRQHESVGSWLYGVAYRIALKARALAARRAWHERQVLQRSPPDALAEVVWHDLRPILDEEVNRLPEKYRAPVVLCHLQGKTNEEAARHLRCPLGTVKIRLARARTLLQTRLTRRGCTLSAAALGGLLEQSAAPAAVPTALAASTVKIATLVATGEAALASGVSGQAALLLEGMVRTLFLAKVKFVAAVILATAVVTAGAGFAVHQAVAAKQGEGTVQGQTSGAKERAASGRVPNTLETPRADAPPQAADEKQPAGNEANEARVVTGRVQGPDGQPITGAKLYLRYHSHKELMYPVRATTGADGRFQFTFEPAKLDPPPEEQPWFQVLALADGYGPDWATPGRRIQTDSRLTFAWLDKSVDLTFRLVKDVPGQGRILDLNGRPVAGATLRVEHITSYDNLDAFLQTVRDRKWPLNLNNKHWGGPFPGQPKVLTTGPDGRFRLEGIGQDREVRFHLEGPGIQYGSIRCVTRELKAPVEPQNKDRYAPGIVKAYGAAFEHTVAPSRLIRGVVRDKKTGRPVAGVEIRGGYNRTQTDQEGRYELQGYVKTAEGYLVDASPVGQPYFSAGVRFPDTPGLDPIQGDIELVSGIPLHGRVTHALTSQPIARARVHYNPLYPNSFSDRLLGPNGAGTVPYSWTETRHDGSYSLVVLPGPGALGFEAHSPKETFMPALVSRQELKELFGDNGDHGDEDRLMIHAGGNSHTVVAQTQFHHLLLLNPEEKAESLTRDVTLQPARTLQGKIVGPDGEPLRGVTAFYTAPGVLSGPLDDDTFTVYGLNPRRTHHVLFEHKEKNVAAAVKLHGKMKEPLTVRLEPCGSVTGRLLDEDGQTAANTLVRAEPPNWLMFGTEPPKVRTDRDGRFHIVGLVPGLRYQVRLGPRPFGQYLFAPVTLKPGESKDLGDVQAKPNR